MTDAAAISGDFANRKFKHGGRPAKQRIPEYTSWSAMLSRCYNPKAPYFPAYGGRGINVCPEWRASYAAFLQDMGRKPSPDHSLDRIDNSKGYEPGNCRWATKSEQSNNRRSSRVITAHGRAQTLVDWSRETGIGPRTIANRLRIGWAAEDAVSAPLAWKKGEARG